MNASNNEPVGDAAAPDAGCREGCDCSQSDCVLYNIQREAHSNLAIVFASIDHGVLDRVIQTLMDARLVLVVSRDRDQICATHMQRIAARRFCNWQHVRCSTREMVEFSAILAPCDVVVGLALGPFDHSSPFDDHTLLLAKRARAIGARVIGLVDRLESTFSAHANDVLRVPGLRPLTFPTYLPAMVLVETLVEILGARCEGAPAEGTIEQKKPGRWPANKERDMNDSNNEPATDASNDEPVTDDSDDGLHIELATGLMIAVAATGVLKGANDETKNYAGEVLESELAKFRAGEGQYGVNHERVAAGDMREADSVIVLVSKCVEKIALFK